MKNPFLLCLVSGFVTGMGNGSVFGAALLCFLGRGGFEDWGGWMSMAYDPSTFTGFIDWAMLIFGLVFYLTLQLALNRHRQMETSSAS
jgi:pilus assembly protein TadC